MTSLLSFIFLMIGLLAKATGLGQRCAYRLEAYEGKRDDLAAFNEAQGMSEAALKAVSIEPPLLAQRSPDWILLLALRAGAGQG